MRILPILALLLVPAAVHAADTQREWTFAAFSYVRRVPAEKGAVNGQPLLVDPETLAQALRAVKLEGGGNDEPLFAPAEVGTFAAPLSEALSLAGPAEDLLLLSTRNRSTGLLTGNALAVTARLFVTEGRLNLIVQEARQDFMPLYTYENRMPEFKFGGRAIGGAAVLKAPGAESRRNNWLVLPLPAAAAPQAAPPAARVVPSVEDRLRDLKRFREQNLITEEEYAKQKQELLEEFRKGGTK